MDDENRVRFQLFSDGTLLLFNAIYQRTALVDGDNGQVRLFDSMGNARAEINAFGGSGHISVTGANASTRSTESPSYRRRCGEDDQRGRCSRRP